MVNFLVAAAIGLIWFGIVYFWFRPEQLLRKHIIKIFLLGMIICVPVGFFNDFWKGAVSVRLEGLVSAGVPMWLLVALLFIFVAPIEEIVKFFIIKSESYRLKAFDTVEEGVMLAMVSALGFATFENYMYMNQAGFNIILLRGWLCPLAHMLFSAFFGYYLGLAKTGRYRYRPLIIEGLVLASLAHGLYNASTQVFWLCVALVVGYLVYYLKMMKTERHIPLMVRFMPKWMEEGKAVIASRPLKRPQLPQIQDPVTNEKIQQILNGFSSLDEQTRLTAIRSVGHIEDRRLHEGLKRLEHDPSPQVRQAAGSTVRIMDAKLKKIYDQQVGRSSGA